MWWHLWLLPLSVSELVKRRCQSCHFIFIALFTIIIASAAERMNSDVMKRWHEIEWVRFNFYLLLSYEHHRVFWWLRVLNFSYVTICLTIFTIFCYWCILLFYSPLFINYFLDVSQSTTDRKLNTFCLQFGKKNILSYYQIAAHVYPAHIIGCFSLLT